MRGTTLCIELFKHYNQLSTKLLCSPQKKYQLSYNVMIYRLILLSRRLVFSPFDLTTPGVIEVCTFGNFSVMALEKKINEHGLLLSGQNETICLTRQHKKPKHQIKVCNMQSFCRRFTQLKNVPKQYLGNPRKVIEFNVSL